jgi:hypothetical protein
MRPGNRTIEVSKDTASYLRKRKIPSRRVVSWNIREDSRGLPYSTRCCKWFAPYWAARVHELLSGSGTAGLQYALRRGRSDATFRDALDAILELQHDDTARLLKSFLKGMTIK